MQPADLRELAVSVVHPGFRSLDDVIAELTELVEDDEDGAGEPGAVTAAEVPALVREVWVSRLAEQATWPTTTDSDRMNEAFAALEENGVLARMDFSCCQNCGSGEIADEARTWEHGPHGYVFFHAQDAERLAQEPALLHLSYGAFTADREGYAAAALAVGDQVVTAVRKAGLRVHWDGTLARRIAVPDLTWHRRLPAADD
jgi:hypothetical protein